MRKIKHLGIARKTGKKTMKLVKRDLKVTSPSLTREYCLSYEKAKGSFVWDADGRKYLDFAAGVAVMNAGHSRPEVAAAVKEQLKKGTHCGFSDFFADAPVKFCETLVDLMPKPLNKVFLSNSGTEAVEAAYKLSRWHSKKKWAMAFENAFHGRTMGSLSLTQSKPVQKKRFAPFLPVKHVPFAYCYRCPLKLIYPDCGIGCLKAVKKAMMSLKGKQATLFVEPVQGEGGYVIPPRQFLQGLRELCDDFNVLLAADECQAGGFRTGNFLAMQSFKVKPDIVSMSKTLGGGLPIGATVASTKVMDWVPGSHANTFGGNLLAAVAGTATLTFMRKKRLGLKAKKMGKFMLKQLQSLQTEYDIIGDVRGKGLMIGVELVKNRKTKAFAVKERQKILCHALEEDLILLPCGMSTIRFCPPLTLSKAEAKQGLAAFETALKCFSKTC
jgi:4-aminobutyrate aminotransferase